MRKTLSSGREKETALSQLRPSVSTQCEPLNVRTRPVSGPVTPFASWFGAGRPPGYVTPCTVNGVTYPGGLPAPNQDANGVTGPETGLVLTFNGSHWVDTLGRNWDNAVSFSLPDDNVFRIDATQNPPPAIPSPPHDGQPFAHVGTVLFNMVVNPANGHVYVTNGDARNDVRFEGQRSPCGSPTSVVGHLSEARITVLDPVSGSVTPRHLNKHLDS